MTGELFSCYGEFPNGTRREAYNLDGPDCNRKMLEWRKAGAVKVGYSRLPAPKRTRWGKVDYRN